MKTLRVLWAVLFSCFAVPALFACTQPGNLAAAFPTWATNAIILVNVVAVPNSPLQAAVSSWNSSLLDNTTCGPFFTFGSLTPNATVNISYVAQSNFQGAPTTGNDDTLETSTTSTITRGLTDFGHAIVSAGKLSSINVYINSVMTANAAIQEVVAHELGHTLNLADCSYPTCPLNSSVMVIVPAGTGAGLKLTVNSTIGQPGPTQCDVNDVIVASPNYICPPPPPPCGGDPGALLPGDPPPPGPCYSPIILDLDGKGFVLTDAAHGVVFDISGTGKPIQLAWIAAGADNAFLALPGPDGLVHNGKQLFGNFTSQPPSDHPNGFAALAVYDDPKNGGNGDGVIDSRDKIFSSLRLWIDANHDGICQTEELHTLPSLGVVSVSLNYALSRKEDQYGNVFRYKAAVDPNDPDPTHVGRTAYDVFFVTLGQPTSKLMPKKPAPAGGLKCVVPAKGNQGMLATAGL